MGNPGSEGVAGQSDILLDAARTDLYRQNAFRVAELAVDATPRDLHRRQSIIEMAVNTGLDIPPGPGRALAMPPPPRMERESDEEYNQRRQDLLREAMQRLTDPERRLVDEFFWFWPHRLGESAKDPALMAMAQNDIRKATETWLRQEQYSEADVSMHNLAVLSHTEALDLESRAAESRLNKIQIQQLAMNWEQAYKRWRVLITQEGFWSRLSARIREIDDPRLTTGTARRMKQSLPLALLLINAELAVDAARRGNDGEVRRQLDIMSNLSGLDADLVTQALNRTIEPIRKQVMTLCKLADTDVDEDPTQGNTITERLLDAAGPLLHILAVVLPAGHPTLVGMQDQVARQALGGTIAYGNKTEKWGICLALINRIGKLTVSASVRERINDNRKIVEGNNLLEVCWFCGENPADKSAEIEVKMHGDVKTEYVFYNQRRITWRHSTVQVPRCASCKQRHTQEANAGAVPMTIGGGIGTCLCILLMANAGGSDDGSMVCIGLAAIGVGIAIGAFIGNQQKQKITAEAGGAVIKPLSAQNDFPRIVALKKEGWQFGEKPPSAT
jgi:hypothetical protein